MNKPSIPKGTRDFSPVEMAKRNYIFNTIRDVYALYGFQQIETPSMETLQTLMGKYGEEGDKLLFKILNSGDCLAKVSDEELIERNPAHLSARMCEKGLRYDLTVPFARYVVMHREELQLPFKRYQIQPVWRADRPQKGRYREFYQCDADVVGSDSLLNEVELMQIVDTVFQRFGIRVQIKINNRKILSGIAEVIGAADKIVDITVAIDKLDKIGIDNVNDELRGDGLSEEQIEKLQPIIMLSGTNDEKLATIASVLSASETGVKGVEETRFILDTLKSLGLKNEVLHLSHLRGEGTRRADRQHHRRRTLRQPHRHLRYARTFRRRHLVWCRPHLRRAQCARPLSRRCTQRHPAAVHQLRRSRDRLHPARRCTGT